jgi:phosphatidylethanolamine-binding protein (PEBP) family uncharacterized protein
MPKPGGGKQGPRIVPPKGAPEAAPTAAQEAKATEANIALASPSLRPAVGSGLALPPAYTCDGRDSWPALSWKGVPQGTKELALFAIDVEPVEGELFFDWAVAGLDPSLEAIEAGKLPKGAIVGKNSFGHNGYSICPQGSEAETYVFALYALPKALSPKRGFDPAALRREALALHGHAGILAASYGRG